VNKSQLIDQIAADADISKAAAGRALDSFIEAVSGALKDGDSVALVGFGTFSVRERAARSRTEKVPKPTSATESPSLSAPDTDSMNESSARPAAALEMSASAAI
jgi:nucleoid DNA-binding protein